MKRCLIVFVFVLCISISFALTNLLNVNFNSGTIPAGWTYTGSSGNWSVQSSSNAGGTSPELMFDNSPITSGMHRFISPPINTTAYYELQLQFNQYLMDDPGSPNNAFYGVEISPDGANWTSIWSNDTSANYGPELTTPIPITTMNLDGVTDYLNTTTFYLAFYFDGSPGDILGWYLDNIKLDATKNAVYGTWSGTHYLTEDAGVPVSRKLTILPGTQVIAQLDTRLWVSGIIRAVGTAADSIRFTTSSLYETWKGIYIYNTLGSDSLYFKHCVFEHGNSYGEGSGVLSINYSPMVLRVENCRFSDNYSSGAAALMAQISGNITIDKCLFSNNGGGNVTTIYVASTQTISISNNLIVHNYSLGGMGNSHIQIQSNGHENCHLFMDSNTVADNAGASYSCYVIGVSSMMLYFDSISINNSIFWNEASTDEIYFMSAMYTNHSAYLNYCDIRSTLIGSNIPYYLNSCVYDNPAFISHATYALRGTSPCVDTGDPALSDPDGSRKDMGAVPLWKKPVIQYVNDVPFDQGLKVKVRWSRSQADTGGSAGGSYSVWRLEPSRSAEAVYIDSPLQLNNLTDSRNICWHTREGDYNFLGTVPAFNFPYYSLNCQTNQDSSSTGTHAMPYIVVYSFGSWFSSSDQVSGYSVDNIAPDPVRSIDISKSGNQISLTWNPVNTGTYNGNSYPELGPVSYKIFCSDLAYFEPGPSNYLTTTNTPFQVINYLGESKKFFRITVMDK